MSMYAIHWEVNEITGRWNHQHDFWAENDYEAVKYAMEWLQGEQVFKLTRNGYRGAIRTVVDCTSKVA